MVDPITQWLGSGFGQNGSISKIGACLAPAVLAPLPLVCAATIAAPATAIRTSAIDTRFMASSSGRAGLYRMRATRSTCLMILAHEPPHGAQSRRARPLLGGVARCEAARPDRRESRPSDVG